MPLSPIVAAACRSLREELARTCGEHVVEVRAFGSRVHGGAREDSDLDVFILLDTADRHLRTAAQNAAWDAAVAIDLPFAITPLVMSRDHFRRLADLERLITKVVMEEGVPI